MLEGTRKARWEWQDYVQPEAVIHGLSGSKLQMLVCCRRMTYVVISGPDERAEKEEDVASE